MMALLLIVSAFSTQHKAQAMAADKINYRLYINEGKPCFQCRVNKIWSEPTKFNSSDISEYTVATMPGDIYKSFGVRKERFKKK
jgi:hypothetical protein